MDLTPLEGFKLLTQALILVQKLEVDNIRVWHHHEVKFRGWFALQRIEELADLDQQKRSLCISLQGPAICAVDLHGPGKGTYVSCATMEDYFTLIRGVFNPPEDSALDRSELEHRVQGGLETAGYFIVKKIALHHQAEPNQAARRSQYLRNQVLNGLASANIKEHVIQHVPED